MSELAVFWGCTIPARFPSIEKATRLVLQDLGAQPYEPSGFTCCPEGTLVKAHDPWTHQLTAARNLALAGATGLDLLTPCNGCYSTFKEAQHAMDTPAGEYDAVQARLLAQGMSWPESLRVFHLAEWLSDAVGTAAVARGAQKSLAGVRIAVHYGCHLLRPQPAVTWDDPLHPTKVEAMVRALGATVVDYPSKMQCCGGALDRCGQRESSLDFAQRKLSDLEEAEVDALVVVCPSCFQQFDLNQAALRRTRGGRDVPVLYLGEVIALAYGHAADEIGLGMHRVSVAPFLDVWEQRLAGRETAAAAFDLSLLDACAGCGACRNDCPVALMDPAFQPTELVRSIIAGDIETVLAEGQGWKCVECYTCLELCPSRIGLADSMRTLKELAAERGERPEQIEAAYDLFLREGTLGTARESARRKLDLPPLPPSGGEDLQRLLARDSGCAAARQDSDVTSGPDRKPLSETSCGCAAAPPPDGGACGCACDRDATLQPSSVGDAKAAQ
jgi:heterodisulfide reductase subunit B/heterodisulfide reductase subunit C